METNKCDWCGEAFTDERPGVWVNNRWRFHEDRCLTLYKRNTLSVKVETALPLHVESDPNYGK